MWVTRRDEKVGSWRYTAPVPWPAMNEALVAWLMTAPDAPDETADARGLPTTS